MAYITVALLMLSVAALVSVRRPKAEQHGINWGAVLIAVVALLWIALFVFGLSIAKNPEYRFFHRY